VRAGSPSSPAPTTAIANDADGPFGFHEAAAEYDTRVVELVRENRLAAMHKVELLVDDAYADSLWQLAMLAGAIEDDYEVALLSYESPTYFGMLCAAYAPGPGEDGR
jgi:aromatic ring-opening dioxygenase LigB subunit